MNFKEGSRPFVSSTVQMKLCRGEGRTGRRTQCLSPAQWEVRLTILLIYWLPTTETFNEVGSSRGQVAGVCHQTEYLLCDCVSTTSVLRWSMSTACETQLILQVIDNPKVIESQKSRTEITWVPASSAWDWKQDFMWAGLILVFQTIYIICYILKSEYVDQRKSNGFDYT